jgi:hypothetical protein
MQGPRKQIKLHPIRGSAPAQVRQPFPEGFLLFLEIIGNFQENKRFSYSICISWYRYPAVNAPAIPEIRYTKNTERFTSAYTASAAGIDETFKIFLNQ